MDRRKKWKYLVVFTVAIGTFLFAAGKLRQIYLEYQKGADTYEELRQYVEEPEKKPDQSKNNESAGSEPEDSYLQIDFEGLRAIYPDIIAWIDIPGAEISYPVLQGKDNHYYLTHLPSGEYGISGSVFMDYLNQSDFSDWNTIIYGHNMKDGSMFANLGKYSEETTYLGNPYFYIYTPEVIRIYHIFSCYSGKTESEAYTYRFSNIDGFLTFLTTIQEKALYKTMVPLMEDSRVVTLSTCVNTSRNHRFIVHGVLNKPIERVNEHDRL